MLTVCESEICARIGWAILLFHMRLRKVTHWYLGGSWAELEFLRELHLHTWFLSRGEQKAGLGWAALSLQGLFMWSLQQGGQPAYKWPQSSKGEFSKRQEVAAAAESTN